MRIYTSAAIKNCIYGIPLLMSLVLYAPASIGKETDKEKSKYVSHLAPDTQPKGYRLGIHAVGGKCFQYSYNLVSFDRFRNAYNTYNANQVKTPMGPLTLKGGYMYGGGVHGLSNYFISFYIDVTTGKQEASAAVALKNGDRRELIIKQKPTCTNMDLLLHVNKRLFIGVALGVEQANSKLFSGYRYAHSFLSYGSDQALNGVYKSKDNRINMGMRMDITIIRQLRLSVRGEYCGVFAGKQNKDSDYANSWSDQMYRKSASGGVHLDGDNHFYLPEDVRNANDDNVYYVGLGQTFAKTYRGWRITTSLVLDLLTHHN